MAVWPVYGCMITRQVRSQVKSKVGVATTLTLPQSLCASAFEGCWGKCFVFFAETWNNEDFDRESLRSSHWSHRAPMWSFLFLWKHRDYAVVPWMLGEFKAHTWSIQGANSVNLRSQRHGVMNEPSVFVQIYTFYPTFGQKPTIPSKKRGDKATNS